MSTLNTIASAIETGAKITVNWQMLDELEEEVLQECCIDYLDDDLPRSFDALLVEIRKMDGIENNENK